ncbi:nuclear RNA export factor 3-like [Puma concolor]|uniref:Nuclear RNA export factor 3-like n=1 Tax=Puma concolor TaxID=9696 RepID=A0A6P6INA3_PUMCO|nr:nuclear RNA export factor 3-like [Puma concolor]
MSERQQQQKCVLPLKKCETYRNEESNDGGNSPQGRQRVWSSLRGGNFGKSNPQYEHGGYEPQLSHHQEDDGNVMMRNVQEYPQVRHTFYSNQQNKRRVKWHNEGHIHVTVWRDKKPLKREMRENTQDGTPGSWFKITIPYGGKYEKTWLVNSIQDHCSVPFTPVDFHYVKNEARFFVQDAGIASALKDVSYKICDEENQKISIFVNPSNVPYSVRYKLKPEEMKQLKLTSVWELNKMKGLKLEELWLEGNPLCDTFPDQSTYISAIRECFPKLLHLDGQTLPPAIIIDTDAPYLIKSSKESPRGSEKLKSLILQFLQQYYLIYDSEDRQGLLCAYHYKACFSLTIPFNPKDPAPSSLCKYFKESRNMKKIKDPYMRVQLLKHTKHDIVCSLSTLPKTQHDINSFVVDMWFHTEMMLCFSVNGVFKEVEGRSQGSVRAFTRTFIATPTNNSSLCIVNDELFVRDASPNETQSMSSIPVSSSTSSSVFILSKEQQEMVQAFSTQSGMKPEWSQKCLQDNEWNYTRAGQVFTMLKNEGKIPEDAFKQIA